MGVLGLAKLTGYLVDKAAVDVNHHFADLTDEEVHAALVGLLGDVRPLTNSALTECQTWTEDQSPPAGVGSGRSEQNVRPS